MNKMVNKVVRFEESFCEFWCEFVSGAVGVQSDNNRLIND